MSEEKQRNVSGYSQVLSVSDAAPESGQHPTLLPRPQLRDRMGGKELALGAEWLQRVARNIKPQGLLLAGQSL